RRASTSSAGRARSAWARSTAGSALVGAASAAMLFAWRSRLKPLPQRASDVEPEVQHVGFLHDVVLALEPQPPRLARAGFALVLHVVVVRDRLGADEAALE